MSQPFDQFARQQALGELDVEAGEFWMENPWMAGEHNLSAYERNGVLLNTGDGKFVDLSYLSGADMESDSRSVVVGDFNNDGMPDVILRNNGGGAVHVFENQFPKTHWLKVTLRGTRSNSQGIGARLSLQIGERTIYRDVQPHNTFFSQMPTTVLFGLGEATQIDRLTVRWPSGKTQVIEAIPVDQHLRVTEED